MAKEIGTLYIVATPIGNLADISQRALEVLSEVDLVVAEDTRHSKRLLAHHEIYAMMTSLHDFNESSKSAGLIEQLLQGKSLALISDAGTPLISDPGYHLVRDARAEGIEVVPVPGCCALIAALSASGLATDRFCFEGFLPAKTGSRVNDLAKLALEQRTLCFYEAPHRIEETLKDMVEVFGKSRQAVVAKELTKAFEQFFCGTLEDVLAELVAKPDVIRGEFVILLEGAPAQNVDNESLLPFMQLLISENLSTKQAANIAAKWLGCKRKEAYALGVSLSGENGEDVDD